MKLTTFRKFGAIVLILFVSHQGFSQQQSASDGHPEDPTVTVDYDNDENVWKGTTVTWTISYTPSDADFSESKLSVSGSDFTLDGMTVTYDCPAESSSLSDMKTPTVSYDKIDVSPSDGPVVFKLNSAMFDTDVVCEEQPAQLEIATTPDYEGSFSNLPSVTFSPSPMDSQGNISQGHDLDPGNHDFTVTGDRDLDDTLNVLSGSVDDMVVVQNHSLSPSAPAGGNSWESVIYHAFRPGDIWMGTRGEDSYDEVVEDLETLSTEDQPCGATITQSDYSAFTVGVSGGVSYGGLSAEMGTTHETGVKYENTWGEDNRHTEVIVKGLRRSVDYILEEQWDDDDDEWVDANNSGTTAFSDDWLLGGLDATIKQSCCGMGSTSGS